jgi:MFS family permease
VGIAMVVHGREKTGMPVAVNGVYGNLGVACAALLTGFLIDRTGWRPAFALPGAAAVVSGLVYAAFIRAGRAAVVAEELSGLAAQKAATGTVSLNRGTLVRVFAVIYFSTGVGGFIFQSATFALPKVFEERLPGLADTATLVGWYTFLVFAFAAVAQLVVGYLIDRHSIRTIFATVTALQCVCFAMMQQVTGTAALVVAIAFALAVFGQVPMNDVLVGRVTPSEWRSRVYGLRYIVTFTVMATGVPFIAWMHANWGFAALFRVLSFLAAAICIAVLTLPRTAAVTGKMEKALGE